MALQELHEDPDRLRAPLVKRGGRFAAASWEEAFAEIERRLPPILARSGRDAAALAIGNPTAHKMGLLLYVTRLARALGKAHGLGSTRGAGLFLPQLRSKPSGG